MKVFHSFLFVLLAIPLTAKAQINSSGFNPEKIFQAQLSGEVYSPPVLFSGSPWYIDDWTRGIVILENGEMVSNVKLRYNGYLDELFWLTPEAFDQVLLELAPRPLAAGGAGFGIYYISNIAIVRFHSSILLSLSSLVNWA